MVLSASDYPGFGRIRSVESAANRFLAEVAADEDGAAAQELMARVTGNYKHGNERTARQHPRNRGR